MRTATHKTLQCVQNLDLSSKAEGDVDSSNGRLGRALSLVKGLVIGGGLY